jgi:orotate phosphoribosyltransferase
MAISVADRFIELLLKAEVLRFGEFKTKSGRLSPFFFNTGQFDSGQRLSDACDLYAEAIAERFGNTVDNLFGPAYKGIPLAVMTAGKLAARLGRDVSFTFNRKEAKDHGEGGLLVGRAYRGGEKVIVVEDVITGGTSINETMPLLQRAKVDVAGIVVGIDRQEAGSGGELSARGEIERKWKLPVVALVNLDEVVDRLHNRECGGRVWIDDALRARIDAYRSQYGRR